MFSKEHFLLARFEVGWKKELINLMAKGISIDHCRALHLKIVTSDRKRVKHL